MLTEQVQKGKYEEGLVVFMACYNLRPTSADMVYAAVCCRMLPYAAVCCRMLTYAAVCCRMLPYAAVC